MRTLTMLKFKNCCSDASCICPQLSQQDQEIQELGQRLFESCLSMSNRDLGIKTQVPAELLEPRNFLIEGQFLHLKKNEIMTIHIKVN